MPKLVLPIAVGMLITGALNTITLKYQVCHIAVCKHLAALTCCWQLAAVHLQRLWMI